ncbi:hypothetical protein COCMIDRAFT_41722 [Bipolaris oryzae ATCC 44560]|uniref:BTB domain-containing protein n=1 Tax=Bipolaris oryzae ATCC 44560 TaxID=930090 RepID=W6YWC4_COCMI|nr:uncharacterized protein COCMIDRAFT_41722 [Bipolaris oryzae ATCC 44560]EUC39844.1 hypothetical protein COCMIDRAFT_41722 [Bipolaris oryzae ATCC 44560]
MCTHATDNQLLPAISKIRDHGEFVDLVLSHNAGSFHVHRIIVCPQSKVFYKACTGGFKEEFTGTIQMDHVHHVELKKLVDFLYSSEYDDSLLEEADISLLQLHARMFALADQYDIPGLIHLAAEKYYSRCTTSWEPLELLVSLQDVYETTTVSTKQLRNIACLAIRKHLPEMLDNKEVAEMYNKVLSEIPDFTKDLLRCYTTIPFLGHCLSCHSHQRMEVLQARCMKCKKGNSGYCW